MKQSWADIMDDHDKKRPTVRPKVKKPDEDKTNEIVIREKVLVPTSVCKNYLVTGNQ